MGFSFDSLLDFVFKNIFYFVAIGIIVYYIKDYLRVKSSFKTLSRSEIERGKFIERMIPNKMPVKTHFYKGKTNLGLITHYKEFEYEFKESSGKKPSKKGNVSIEEDQDKKPIKKESIQIIQMLVKPVLLGSLANPFAKVNVFQINGKYLEKYPNKYCIPNHIYLDKLWGIYYDETTNAHTELMKNDNIMRTDLNQIASIYFVKSQEQSTYDPIHAHALAMKERELQIELAKKKGQSETI